MRIGCMAWRLRVAGVDGPPSLNLLPRGRSSGIIRRDVPDRRVRADRRRVGRGCCASGTRSACSDPHGSTPTTGYRAYSPAQLPELRRILALRDLGVPLAEIADLRRRRRGPARGARAPPRRARARRAARSSAGSRRSTSASRMADRPRWPDVVVRPVAAERVARAAAGRAARTTRPPSTSSRRTSATSARRAERAARLDRAGRRAA